MRFRGLFKGNAFDAAVNRAMSGTGQVGEVAGMQFSKRDVADRLPDDARAVLDDLRSRRDDAAALSRAASEALNDAIGEKTDAESRLSALRADRLAKDDHPEVIRLQSQIARAAGEIATLREKADAREYGRQQLGGLVEHVETWLSRLPSDGAIEPHTGTVKPSAKATIESARRKVAELKADLAQVEAAPITSTAARALARAEIERLAEKGRPDCFNLVERGSAIGWPTVSIRAPLWGHVNVNGEQPQLVGWASVEVPDVLAIDCWERKDSILAALEAEITEAADDPHALSDEARAERIAEINASILAAERIEVALVSQAAGDVLHRSDVDPRAILGLADSLPGPRE